MNYLPKWNMYDQEDSHAKDQFIESVAGALHSLNKVTLQFPQQPQLAQHFPFINNAQNVPQLYDSINQAIRTLQATKQYQHIAVSLERDGPEGVAVQVSLDPVPKISTKLLAVNLGGSSNRQDYLRHFVAPSISWTNPTGHHERFCIKAERCQQKRECKATTKLAMVGPGYSDFKVTMGHKWRGRHELLSERSQQIKLELSSQDKSKRIRLRGRWVSNIMGKVLPEHQHNHYEWGVKTTQNMINEIYEYEDGLQRGHSLRTSAEAKASDRYAAVMKVSANHQWYMGWPGKRLINLHNVLQMDCTMPLVYQNREVALTDRVAKYSQLRGYSGINWAAMTTPSKSLTNCLMLNNVTKVHLKDFPVLKSLFPANASTSLHPFFFLNGQYLNQTALPSKYNTKSLKEYLLDNTRVSWGVGLNGRALDTHLEMLMVMGHRQQSHCQYQGVDQLLTFAVNISS